MAKPVCEWSDGSISVAVESGMYDANKEEMHVHVYKRGRRTDTRISLKGTEGRDLDRSDVEKAEALFDKNYYEIVKEYEKVKDGYYGH